MITVERLHELIEESNQRKILNLLYHLGSAFLGILLGADRAQSEQMHCVLFGQLVRAAQHELPPLDRYGGGSEEGSDDQPVILGTELNNLDGGFEVVQKAMDVGRLATVWSSCRSGT